MARRQPTPQVRPDASATSATILPGVALPAWAYGPVAPEPEPAPAAPEPAAPAATAPEPAPELVHAGVPAVSEQSTAPVAPVPLPPPPAAFRPEQPSPVSEPEPAVAVPAAAVAAPEAAVAAPAPEVMVEPVVAETPVAPVMAAPYAPAPTASVPADPGSVLPGAHRAVSPEPQDSGTSANRRPLLLVAVLVIVVLLGAFAAFVYPGFMNSTSDDTSGAVVVTRPPAVALPATVAGHTKSTTPQAAAVDARAGKVLTAAGAMAVTAATYVKPGSAPFTLAAGLAPRTTAARGTFFSLWAHAGAVAAPMTANAGKAGVTAQCGTVTVAGKAAGECAFLGPKLAGTVSVAGASPSQVAGLLPALVAAPSAR